jgi:hypothetical protein
LRTEDIRKNTIKHCPICDQQFKPKKTLKEIYCSPKCQKLIGRKIYKMMQTCREMIGTKKEERSHVLLGYSPKQLLDHLQTFPQWDSLKHGTWHLDHKLPIIAFVRNGINDPSIICNLSNLQPLAGSENCSKNDKFDQIEFERYIQVITASRYIF